MVSNPFYCFDMDGTLVSTQARAHLKGSDWKRYHTLATFSPPIIRNKAMLSDLAWHTPVIINTARDKSHYAATIDWLFRNDISPADILMGQRGADVYVQKVANMQLVSHKPQIDCRAWFDDDPVMIEIGRKLGFNMVQVGE